MKTAQKLERPRNRIAGSGVGPCTVRSIQHAARGVIHSSESTENPLSGSRDRARDFLRAVARPAGVTWTRAPSSRRCRRAICASESTTTISPAHLSDSMPAADDRSLFLAIRLPKRGRATGRFRARW